MTYEKKRWLVWVRFMHTCLLVTDTKSGNLHVTFDSKYLREVRTNRRIPHFEVIFGESSFNPQAVAPRVQNQNYELH